jgi:ATP-dependent helicase HrpA
VALLAAQPKLVRDIEHLEHKSRRPDVLVDDELIHAFYDAKIPEGIVTLAAFDHWRREAEARTRNCSAWKRSS